MPLLDVLQSVPILSFLPVVLLSFSAVLPPRIAAELAAIVLIFTSQAWNLIFAWYQSLKTIPSELREAAAIFHFNGWLRFRTLELPFAAISLIWNSMMSWAGGWFFLMAAEIFTVGERDFRLPGLGAYLQEAANRGDIAAIAWGLGALVSVVVVLDQLVWRPLLAWSNRFKLEMVAGAEAPSSWFYSVLRHSRLILSSQHVVRRGMTHLDVALLKWFPPSETQTQTTKRPPWRAYAIAPLGGAVLLYGLYRAGSMLLLVSAAQWRDIAVGVGATLLRVVAALVIALAWTLPLGVAIGTRPHLAARVQPLAQIAASIPATALFPVVVLVIAGLPAGMNLAAVLLMLMGTQWYLLFNVIAGASAIPQDLQYTAGLLQLSRWKRWRILILPALFPYLITGAVTASGGAWNASIVAEYSDFAGYPRYVTGVGSLIAQATCIRHVSVTTGRHPGDDWHVWSPSTAWCGVASIVSPKHAIAWSKPCRSHPPYLTSNISTKCMVRTGTAWSPLRTSTSACMKGSSSPCWGLRVVGRAPCCASSPACSGRPKAACCIAASPCPASTRTPPLCFKALPSFPG